VVEDCPADVDLLLLAFQRAAVSHPADVVHNAKDAIAYLASADPLPALVILDVNLPDMPGFEVLRVCAVINGLQKFPLSSSRPK
jgi:DNA-binding response OmpR family regulator